MAEIVKVPDHVAQALARFTSAFKDKVQLQALAATYLAEVQAVEDALCQLIFDTRLESPNCVGVLVDEIGALVGQPRNGVTDDATYKIYIRARQRVTRSNGRPEDIYAIYRTLGISGMRLELQPPAGFTLYVHDPITAAEAAIFLGFLQEARGGGINGQLQYQLQDDALTFAFLDYPGGGTLGDTSNPATGGIFAGVEV